MVVVDSKRCGSLSGGERDIYGKGISDDGYLYIRYEAIEKVDFLSTRYADCKVYEDI